MSFLKNTSDGIYHLTLYVKPNSYHQKIEQDGDFLVISLKAKARRNKANKELVSLLKSKLDISAAQVRFVAGLTSQDKVIELEFLDEINIDEIKNKLLK